MDITETKRLERQLHQAQKMEALGTLAGGVAHDFNNLLQVILGYSDMMLLTKNRQDPDYKGLFTMRQTAKDGGELVQGLLAFARKSKIELRPLNPNQVVERVREMLSRTIPKMIEIELDLAHDVKTIDADPGQIDQILLNLAVNAKDAMPEGGKLIIGTKNVTLEKDYANPYRELGTGVSMSSYQSPTTVTGWKGRSSKKSLSRSSRQKSWGREQVSGCLRCSVSSKRTGGTSRATVNLG